MRSRTDGPSLFTVYPPTHHHRTMPNTRTKAAKDADESRPLTLPAPDADPANMGDVRLLKAAIACTPDPLKPGRAIPDTRFAADIAKCNDRTLRRYLANDRVLPSLLREKCEEIVATAARKAARAANGNGAKVPA